MKPVVVGVEHRCHFPGKMNTVATPGKPYPGRSGAQAVLCPVKHEKRILADDGGRVKDIFRFPEIRFPRNGVGKMIPSGLHNGIHAVQFPETGHCPIGKNRLIVPAGITAALVDMLVTNFWGTVYLDDVSVNAA